MFPNDDWNAGTYEDDDGDDSPNGVDPDIDGDGLINESDSLMCGATVSPGFTPERHPYRIPERLEGAYAGEDDDGDGLIDELLPQGAASLDCDGDGFSGAVEQSVFSRPTTIDDQAACATTPSSNDEADDRWPADFDDNQVINVTDVFQLLPPVLGSTVPPTSPRYDLYPDGVINNTDVFQVLPPVLGSSCKP